MVDDAAEWIRQWLGQYIVITNCGTRIRHWSSVTGGLTQSGKNMANSFEDQVGSTPCPATLRFVNDFVPHGVEVVLLCRKSVVYVKIGELPEDVWLPGWGIGAKQLPDDVDQDGDRGAVAMRDMLPKSMVRYAIFVLDK